LGIIKNADASIELSGGALDEGRGEVGGGREGGSGLGRGQDCSEAEEYEGADLLGR